MKLTLCVIAKDEESCIGGMIESAKDIVDEIIVVDTGSSDNTIAAAKAYTDKVYKHPKSKLWVKESKKFSFAEARNYGLKKCDGDWVLILDCDERMDPSTKAALRPALESIPDDMEMVMLRMIMCLDDGVEYQRFLAERVIRPRLRFHSAMHNWVDARPDKRCAIPDIRIIHNRAYKTEEGRASRGEQRLAMSEYGFLGKIAENPEDRRSLFYLAGTYYDSNDLDKAVPWFERYLEVNVPGFKDFWAEERYQAELLLSDCYRRIGRQADSDAILSRSLVDNWRRGEALVQLGESALGRGDLDGAEWWFQIASLKPEPVDPMFVEPPAHTFSPHIGLWHVYRIKSDTEQALKHADLALQWNPPQTPEIIRYKKSRAKYGGQKIVCLIDRGQMDFIQPVIDHWIGQGKEVRYFDNWEAAKADCETWADIIWCEWAGPLAVEASKLEKRARIIVRVHGYEVHSGQIPLVNWLNVDDAIFVADYLREIAVDECPIIKRTCRVCVVPGGVDVDKFSIAPAETGVEPTQSRYLTDDSPRLDEQTHSALLHSEDSEVEFWSRPYEYQWVLSQLRETDSVLDYGCGKGKFPDLIATKARELSVYDIDTKAIDEQRERGHKQHVEGQTYDVLTCVSVMEHVDSAITEIQKIYRMLNPGGRLIMTFDTPRCSPITITRMLRNVGFRVVNSTSIPDNPIGATWGEHGWEARPDAAELHCYSIEAIKPNGKSGNKIAMACYGNTKKQFPLALQILAECPERFELHIATEWQDTRLVQYLEQLIEELGLEDQVMIYPWQSDLNAFYADKDFYLSTSMEESFQYSLAEAMAAGLKPIIHCWRSVRNFYPDEWIFGTVREAVEMLKDRGNPRLYRDYAIGNLSLMKNLKRIDRLIKRPSVAVTGAERQASSFEAKVTRCLEQLGCDTEGAVADTVILMGHKPTLDPWMENSMKVLWHHELVKGNSEKAVGARALIADLVPQLDMVITHEADWVDPFKSMGAKKIDWVEGLGACWPWRPIFTDKRYPVGFYGTMTKRREKILKKIAKDFPVHVMTDPNHERLNEFINSCDVVLNIHAYDEPLVESRVAECMAAGVCVISEPLPEGHPYREDCFIQVPTDQIVATVKGLLENEKERKAIGKRAHRWVVNRLRLVDQVEKVLDLIDMAGLGREKPSPAVLALPGEAVCH